MTRNIHSFWKFFSIFLVKSYLPHANARCRADAVLPSRQTFWLTHYCALSIFGDIREMRKDPLFFVGFFFLCVCVWKPCGLALHDCFLATERVGPGSSCVLHAFQTEILFCRRITDFSTQRDLFLVQFEAARRSIFRMREKCASRQPDPFLYP